MVETRAGRETIASAKEQVDKAMEESKKAEQALQETRKAHQEAILSFIGGYPGQVLAPCAERILQYADQENTDPSWLYRVLDRTGYLAVKGHLPFL